MNPNLNPDQFGEYMSGLGALADARVKARFHGGFRDDYFDWNATEPASVQWAAKEAHKRGADGVN